MSLSYIDTRTIYGSDFMHSTIIEERTVELANYIIETRCTVREAAKKFGISKSTVHKDVTERLLKINESLARKARDVLMENKQERHIRGGIATREKYRRENNSKCSE